MIAPSSELFRIDPLTGCRNYLGFVEALANATLAELSDNVALPEVVEKIPWTGSSKNSSILFLDLCGLKILNETKGRTYGDSAVRWMGILLGEESNCPVFRLGGGDYALMLTTGTHDDHIRLLEHILERVEKEADAFGMTHPAVHVGLIQYENSPTSPDSILMQMGEAIIKVKYNHDSAYMVFNTNDFNISTQALTRDEPVKASEFFYPMRWISRKNVYHVMDMGKMLDQIQKVAYTDAISGLPNMQAALLQMESLLKNSGSTSGVFSVLLMDGDNIRKYNEINYATGDAMIRDISAVFRNNLRPNDFVARWRSGDEFIAILPDTSLEGVRLVAERFRLAVNEASRDWRFLTTISIGVSNYPSHGVSIDALVDKAESALKRAKDQGKNRVVIAD